MGFSPFAPGGDWSFGDTGDWWNPYPPGYGNWPYPGGLPGGGSSIPGSAGGGGYPGSRSGGGGGVGTGPNRQGLQNIPPWLKAIIAAGGFAAGAFPTTGQTSGNAASTSNINQTGSTTGHSDIQSNLNTLSQLLSTSNINSSTQPTLSPASAALMSQLTRQYGNLAGSNVNLAPYAGQQTQNINRNSQIQSQAVQNALAARGLSTSPVAGTAEANIQANRVGQINNLQQQIPLLQNQLTLGNLGAASGFFSTLPRGSVSQQTGTQSQLGGTSQTGQTIGDTSGTSTQNISQTGTTNQTGNTSQGGGIGSGIAGLLGILLPLLLYGQRQP